MSMRRVRRGRTTTTTTDGLRHEGGPRRFLPALTASGPFCNMEVLGWRIVINGRLEGSSRPRCATYCLAPIHIHPICGAHQARHSGLIFS